MLITIVTIIAVILLFASLVLIHEYGHFLLARRNGVEVEEFGFGFPPKVFGKKYKGVEYTFNLLPLGGFVRMKGEDAADVSPGSFASASLWSKTKILMAGVFMNLLAGFALFYLLCVTGIPGLGQQLEPTFLKSTVVQPRQLVIANVEAGSPAAGIGLRSGDYLVSIDGEKPNTPPALSAVTKREAGNAVEVVIRRGSETLTRDVTLRPANANGGQLGIGTQQVYQVKYGPLTSVVAALYIIWMIVVLTAQSLVGVIAGLPSLIIGLFGSGVPEAAAALSGPIGIVYILTKLTAYGWPYVVLIMANISIALAIFNALPLPALDGGRLFVSVVQRITGKPWKAETEAIYHTVGFFVLIGFMLLVSVYDVRKFF